MTDETTITDNSLLGGTQEGAAAPATGDEAPAAESPAAAAESTDEKFEFVADKYRAEGRSEQESLELQAKSYTELESKFGSFTGAPDDYKVELSDDLVESGIEVANDDPLIQKAMEFAKNSNMSQEGFNGMVGLYINQQLAEQQATNDIKADEIKSLGSNAQARLGTIDKYIAANFDSEIADGIRGMVTNAESVKAIEAIIQKSRSAPVAADETTAVPSVTAQEVKDMQFAKDEDGNRRINVDAAFKAEFKRKQAALYGDQPYRQTVG